MIKKIHFVLFIINLLIAIPAVYMILGLPLVFARHGWSGAMIGLFLLSSLPTLGKFLLAYPVERFRLRGCHYVYWTAALMVLLAVILLLLALPDITQHKMMLFGLMLLANLMMAWVEIPINTLMIQILPEVERLRAGSLRSAAMSVSAIIGGGVLLLLQQKFGWSLPFIVMATSLLCAVPILSLLAKHERDTGRPIATTMVSLADMAGFFAKAHRLWLFLLLLWFALVATVWTFLKPMLFAYGLPEQQVAIFIGLGGGTVSALSALLAPRLLAKMDKHRAMLRVASVDIMLLSSFTILLFVQANIYVVAISAMLIGIALGLTSALIFRLMMDFVQVQGKPLYYGLQSALFQSGRILLSVLAGSIADARGHKGLMVLMVMLALSVYIVIARNQQGLMQLFTAKDKTDE